MITRKITYTDFNDVEVTKDATFHASKTDLLILTTKIEKLQDTEDMSIAFPILKDILITSYGERRGDLFVQTDEVKDQLRFTPMLDELVFDLLKDPKGMVKFIVGLLPKDISRQLHSTKEGTEALAEVNKAIDDALALEEATSASVEEPEDIQVENI